VVSRGDNVFARRTAVDTMMVDERAAPFPIVAHNKPSMNSAIASASAIDMNGIAMLINSASVIARQTV
jgi:hypothetical protein